MLKNRVAVLLGAFLALAEAAHAAPKKPVLLVVANRHYYYKEYGDTRRSLEAAGYPVKVGAGLPTECSPHQNTGEGADRGILTPDVTLGAAKSDDYAAIAFVGGWGASQYQPNFPGTYSDQNYASSPAVRAAANRLINEFLAAKKPVGGLCHGVTVLAWARVDGVSPLDEKKVVAPPIGGPACKIDGQYFKDAQLPSRWSITENNGTAFASRSLGNAGDSAEDVWVDGLIVTGEDYDSAALFGKTLAAEIGKRQAG